MRLVPVAVALSVVGHGAALAWIATRPHAARAALPQVAIAAPRAARRSREPIAVTVLDGDSPRAGIGAPRRVAAGSSAAPHVETAPAAHADPIAPRPLDLGLSGAFVESFLARPPPVSPPPEAPVLIDEQIDEVSSRLHDPMTSPAGRTAARRELIALMNARDHAELQRDGDGYKADHLAFAGHVDVDGTAHLEDKPTGLMDALMRAHHDDPYASNKLAFLDRTRDERYAIGKRAKRGLLARSGQLALDTLKWIWSKTTNVAERKQAVFDLWDACVETGDAELVAGGRDARAMIVEFVRAHLIGPDAYTPDELAALNARRLSTATFAP